MPEPPPPAPPSPPRFEVQADIEGGARRFRVARGTKARTYRLPDAGQNSYLDFFAAAAGDFGCRVPSSRRPFAPPPAAVGLHPLLTAPASPDILYGYGDPCVLRAPDPRTGAPVWWLTVTSNDAPNAFPILRSEDLHDWRPAGFVFPEGQAPAWTLTGLGRADFWAPEMHRVGGEYWTCFSARRQDRELAIGLARSSSPLGPFAADPEPLLGGGVIDPHLLADPDGPPLLFWKEDTNGVWPRLLAELLDAEPGLADDLLPDGRDRLAAALSAALWPWARRREPMEQFFALQPLIEAAADDFPAFEARLRAAAAARPGQAAQIRAVLAAAKTRIYAQPLSADGRALTGERTLIVENDQTWEAHLIEGVWVHPHAGRYYLFYAGNDFSTHHYGVGCAVADRPLGPYRKGEPLLRSSAEWSGPGHPSVAPGPDGEPWLFLHAFRPGQMGYKAFRALLGARLRLGPEGASLA